MKLFTIHSGQVIQGIELRIKNLGYAKVPIICVSEGRDVTVSPPYPEVPRLYFGHFFLFGGKNKELHVVDLRQDMGFEEMIVLSDSKSTFCKVILAGDSGCLSRVSKGEVFRINGSRYVNNGTTIAKMV